MAVSQDRGTNRPKYINQVGPPSKKASRSSHAPHIAPKLQTIDDSGQMYSCYAPALPLFLYVLANFLIYVYIFQCSCVCVCVCSAFCQPAATTTAAAAFAAFYRLPSTTHTKSFSSMLFLAFTCKLTHTACIYGAARTE